MTTPEREALVELVRLHKLEKRLPTGASARWSEGEWAAYKEWRDARGPAWVRASELAAQQEAAPAVQKEEAARALFERLVMVGMDPQGLVRSPVDGGYIRASTGDLWRAFCAAIAGVPQAAPADRPDRMNRAALGSLNIDEVAAAPVEPILKAVPLDSYSPEDQAFYRFWYSHMLHDLMQPPLADISHSTARYIWDAACGSNDLGKRTTSAATASGRELPDSTAALAGDSRCEAANGGNARAASGGCASPLPHGGLTRAAQQALDALDDLDALVTTAKAAGAHVWRVQYADGYDGPCIQFTSKHTLGIFTRMLRAALASPVGEAATRNQGEQR